jgi:tRNA(Ile)-lysidine synthase
MAASATRRNAERAIADPAQAAVAADAPSDEHAVPCVAVAFSGGRDSTALLHAALKQAPSLGLRVAALHVNHRLQPQADAWQAELQRRCAAWRRRGAPLDWHARRLTGRPAAGESIEAWARRERYAALAEMAHACGATLVLLGHHRADQAETVLLQLLRGAGARGLAAMPRLAERDGLSWGRPWVAMPRDAIDAYVRRHRLRHLEDDSNTDRRFARNRLRHDLLPTLATAFPGAEAALGTAAARAQSEAQALAELAAADLAALVRGDALDIERWLALSPARRANALRAWLRARAGRGADERLVARLLDELPACRGPARWPAHDGSEWACYRGELRWLPASSEAVRRHAESLPVPLPIAEAGDYAVPDWHGRLRVEPVAHGGVALARLAHARLAPRSGAEQFQRAPRSVPRALKKQYQAAGIAAWERKGPLLYCEGQLVFVPGLGIDARALAQPGVSQVNLCWLPDEQGSRDSLGKALKRP